ncbi:hypothetical protein [Streptomyces sp. L2]|uniref:hypothetical protein n=1 Tax=Streptomyces sp. L2 TaxID=2162665 RepID=UPI0010128F41|nr:hypothetical protein [Streptomyces sp. L2]
MGERQSDGLLSGRRHLHPAGTGPAEAETTPLEARLAALLRADAGPADLDPAAEERTLAAFRAARDTGTHRARTRRRDDWRPREPRRLRLWVRATLSVLVAGLALGGVAVAAIGSGGPGASHAGGDGARQRSRPSAGTTRQPDAQRADGESRPDTPSPTGAAPARPGHPVTAQDTAAHCRAYRQGRVTRHGKALDATAWQRLVTAAGGTNKVAAYCTAQLAADDTAARDSGRNDTGVKPSSGTKGSGSAHSAAGGTGGGGKAVEPGQGDAGK